jgi:hypothetical protein
MTALKTALLAIQPCNSATSPPANGVSGALTRLQCWADTSTAGASIVTYKTYDGASWVPFGQLNIDAYMAPVSQRCSDRSRRKVIQRFGFETRPAVGLH